MKQLSNINPVEPVNLPIPPFDHKEPEDDDCGLPESPIFSNYAKYLWRRPNQSSRTRPLTESRENTDGNSLRK